MNNILLQAHRGVSTDYPENTKSAILGAVKQEYPIIEIDPSVTKDGEIVLMHDKTINRTGRNADGSKIKTEMAIADITYEDLLKFDFGVWFSDKFKGEKAPLLSEILEISRDNDLLAKIDNKFQRFSKESIEKLFETVNKIGAKTGFTVTDLELARLVSDNVPNAEIHYDGKVTEEILQQLCDIVPNEKLTVWLPYPTRHNTWVKIPFVDDESAKLVKKYAKLGLWILSEQNDYNDAVSRFAPNIIETTGKLKPTRSKGFIVDMHTHSEHSHDSVCPIVDMAESQKNNKISAFAVTDHCDIEYFETQDLERIIGDSVLDADKNNFQFEDIEILKGVEIGEGFWHKEVTEKIVSMGKYDVIIGSIHAVKFEGYEMPYSQMNFADMEKDTAEKYFDKYLDDMIYMIENTEFDVLAHLTCPLRYINGKYGLNIDCKDHKEKITSILRLIIEKNAALEVNTSCKGSSYDEFMPEEWIVAIYKELGGERITLGSDAHIAKNASHAFADAVEMLKRQGFDKAYYYKNRIAYSYKI